MKILFLTAGDSRVTQSGFISDYCLDGLLIGLRELGHEVLDFPKRSHLYKGYTSNQCVWGRNFNLQNSLDEIHREDDINLSGYELCIIGIHHTKAQDKHFVKEVVKYYQPIFGKNLLVVDGHDTTDIHQLDDTLYFKRELTSDITHYIKPIDFAIPESKILPVDYTTLLQTKENHIAPLIPVNQSIDQSYMSTYIYNTEESYMDMYAKSWFGLTSKKGGWSTMRHLEIIAAGCVPYFVDIEHCPENTLHRWDKKILSEAKQIPGIHFNFELGFENLGITWPHCGVVNKNNPGYIDWTEFVVYNYVTILRELRSWLFKHGTCRALGSYVLNTWKEYNEKN